MRVLCCLFFSLLSSNVFSAVNLYSAREERLIKPILERFTNETGIKVNLTTAKDDVLLRRLEVEGEHSAADVVITVDVARLHRAKTKGLFQRIPSLKLEKVVPSAYRDPGGFWYGLSIRARTIIYRTETVRPTSLSSYLDLANPKWRGKVCVRSSNNPYNQSLVANLIARYGVERIELWAKGLVANFARSPKGGDRDQIRAVAAGLCDVALINQYYLGSMLHSPNKNDVEAAERVAIFWPNASTHGTHVNLSGIGVAKNAPHLQEAMQLIEFLVSEEAQSWYAAVNYEYPVRQNVPVSAQLEAWGVFKRDTDFLQQIGSLNTEAVKLMDRAGWR